MKLICTVFSIIFVVTLVIGGTAYAGNPVGAPAQGTPGGKPSDPPPLVMEIPPIDGIAGIAFIHYPKKYAPAKPPWAGGPDEDGEVCEYKYRRIHWNENDLPVNYLVNLTAYESETPFDGSFLDGIQAAFQTWEADDSSCMDFDYDVSTYEYGLTDELDSKRDYLNTVSWMNISPRWPGAIAVAVIWYYVNTKEIIEADTILNSDPEFAWAQTASGDPDNDTMVDTDSYDVDVQNINTHEAGHWLMLEDLYDADAEEHTMYGYSADCELKKRTLDCGDRDGIRRIYP